MMYPGSATPVPIHLRRFQSLSKSERTHLLPSTWSRSIRQLKLFMHPQELDCFNNGLTFNLCEPWLYLTLLSKIKTTFLLNWGILSYFLDYISRFNLLHFKSYKFKRVVRSVIGGETYIFADRLDLEFILINYLSRLLKRKVPITMLIESDCIFKFIVKASTTK